MQMLVRRFRLIWSFMPIGVFNTDNLTTVSNIIAGPFDRANWPSRLELCKLVVGPAKIERLYEISAEIMQKAGGIPGKTERWI